MRIAALAVFAFAASVALVQPLAAGPLLVITGGNLFRIHADINMDRGERNLDRLV